MCVCACVCTSVHVCVYSYVHCVYINIDITCTVCVDNACMFLSVCQTISHYAYTYTHIHTYRKYLLTPFLVNFLLKKNEITEKRVNLGRVDTSHSIAYVDGSWRVTSHTWGILKDFACGFDFKTSVGLPVEFLYRGQYPPMLIIALINSD